MKRIFGSVLQGVLGETIIPEQVQAVGGGSINRCYRVVTDKDSFFVKENSSSRFPGMFAAEVKGLQLLANNTAFRVPKAFGIAERDDQAYLVMEYIAPAAPGSGFWEAFGHQLAAMHKVSAQQFGLDHENYIGSLAQRNTPCDTWNMFFIDRRLQPQLKLASDQRLLQSADIQAFERLCKKLDQFFAPEPPALLHGDLWSGNFIIDEEGRPALIDPAVYYGHRLMDIGMSRLFGGFNMQMYQHYREHYSLQDNWTEAADICNLYPLLVHVNLFGESYVSQVRSILKSYS